MGPDSIGKRMGDKRPKATGPPPPTAAGKRELALLLRELLEKRRGKGGKGSKGPKPTGDGPKPTRPFDGPMPTDLPDVFPTQAGKRELSLLLRELLEERRGKGGKGSKGPKPTRGGPMPTGSFDGPMPTGPFDGPMPTGLFDGPLPTDLPDGFFDDLMPTGSDLMFPMPTDNIGKRVGSMGGK